MDYPEVHKPIDVRAMAAGIDRLQLFPLFLVFLLAGVLFGCEQSQNQYVAPPPPQVTVARPVQQAVTDYLEFTGNTAALMLVDIRARVQGYLESKHFDSGGLVEKDKLLFVIDPKPFEASLAAAKAQLASAEAKLMAAESDYQRKEIASRRGAITEAEVVQALAARNAASAEIESAKATITKAELDLSYTQVTAPISGAISRNLVDVGNLVGNGEATLLTTITAYDPMYVYFNLNERDLLKVLEDKRPEVEQQGGNYKGQIPLFMGLANGTDYPFKGTLDFAETGVNPNTGTIQLRGVFPNPKRPPELIPGLFARVRLPMDRRDDALLVSERAIGSDQSGDYLLVVNSENVVEKRPIVKGQQIGEMRVINEGISADDWIVISGVLRARPGATVDPQQSEMPAVETEADQELADKDNSAAVMPAEKETKDEPGTKPAAEAEAAAVAENRDKLETDEAEDAKPAAEAEAVAAENRNNLETPQAVQTTATEAGSEPAQNTETRTSSETAQATAIPVETEPGTETNETASDAGPADTNTAQPDMTVASAATADTAAAEATDKTAEQSQPATALSGPSLVDKITQRGHIIAAVQRDFKPFSFSDETGKQIGFEVDLMREFAKRWLGDEAAVKFLPVFSEERIPALLEGRADIIAAAVTNTPERQQSIDFSLTYFQDGQRLLVLEGAAIDDVCQLDGLKVGVTRTSTANENLQKQAADCGISIEIMPVDNPGSALVSVKSGIFDAYASDSIALEHFAADGPFKVVGNHFSSEPYGLGLPKGDARLKKMLDTTLQAMYADGALAAIYQKWFGDSLKPYPILGDTGAPERPGTDSGSRSSQASAAESSAIEKPAAEAEESAQSTTYTVQSGDTLSKIAGKVYGDVSPGAWKRIYEANAEAIGANPANLRRGMVLNIP